MRVCVCVWEREREREREFRYFNKNTLSNEWNRIKCKSTPGILYTFKFVLKISGGKIECLVRGTETTSSYLELKKKKEAGFPPLFLISKQTLKV